MVARACSRTPKAVLHHTTAQELANQTEAQKKLKLEDGLHGIHH